jgi:hypothetical protein
LACHWSFSCHGTDICQALSFTRAIRLSFSSDMRLRFSSSAWLRVLPEFRCRIFFRDGERKRASQCTLQSLIYDEAGNGDEVCAHTGKLIERDW